MHKKQLEKEIALRVQSILDLLGEDITREGLRGTPTRVAKYLLEFLNYYPGNTDVIFESIQTDQMVIVKDIPFYSLCEHHMLGFHGKVSVGYLTGSNVIGLSKIARIVQKHAHKLQIQERLAHDIADDLEKVLKDAGGVAVYIEAHHMCMSMRGIQSQGNMITSVLRGSFLSETSTKEEFLLLIK